MNARKLLNLCLVSFWILIVSSVAWQSFSQLWLPGEIRQFIYAPGYTNSSIFILSLAILMLATWQLWQKKPIARVSLLIGIAGLILSEYFTEYRVEYYGVATLANAVYLVLGIITALVFSPAYNDKILRKKSYSLVERRYLFILGIISILSCMYSFHFVTSAPIILKNYIASLHRPILGPLFFFILEVQLISIILLNLGLRFVRHLYLLSLLLMLILDLSLISTNEGGGFAIFSDVYNFISGILLMIIYCDPLANFFIISKKIHRVALPKKDLEIISKAFISSDDEGIFTSVKEIIKESWHLVYGLKFLFLLIWIVPFLTISLIGSQYVVSEPLRIVFSYGLFFLGTFLSMLGLRRVINLPLHIKTICSQYIKKFFHTLVFFVIIYIAAYSGAFLLSYILIKSDLPMIYIVFEELIRSALISFIFAFVLPLILLTESTVLQAIRITFLIIRQNGISIICYWLIMSILLIFSSLTFGLGLLWSVPMYCIMSGILFRNVLGLNSTAELTEKLRNESDLQ
ncbi:MAG: hypothetical protein H0T84_02740 [Tatlockia sp.]|nr:hypothetical protein [Tatlockia sp.]